uniref:Uncharacterized protein n=1 Tax=Triticum urartu TaxID=4572 RepID=A0A8R7THE4_TRIUA
MDYISPERSLDGTCGDPGPLFGDQDGCLLEHMDYHGEGITQPESPPLNDGLLVDAADQISYLSADSVPYMNDQIMCNTMKSASTSPASPLKQDEEHHVHIESDMQNDAAERKVHHNDDCEVRTTSPGYDVHQNTEVVEGVLPPELHESSEEGIHQGTDHLQQGIILLKDVGHHLPTGRLDWVSLGGICLLQVLAMPPQSESWRRNLQSLDV